MPRITEYTDIKKTDNDDDAEPAAGGRLAHLLQILVRVGNDRTQRTPLQCIDNFGSIFSGLQQRPSGSDAVLGRHSFGTG